MVFSVKTLNESLQKPYNNRDIIDEDFSSVSFFESSLTFLLDESREFECNILCLTEGFLSNKIKNLSIKDILDKIFEMFISAIESLDANFKIFFTKFINKDPRIKLYRKKLENFEGYISYNKPMYNYTNIFVNNSFTDFKSEIEKVYNNFIDDITKLQKANTPMDFAKALNDIEDSHRDYNEYFDNLRGKIVGKNSLVSRDNYASELFKFFRDGKEQPVEMSGFFSGKNLSGEFIRNITSVYFAYPEQNKIITRESIKLKSEARAVKVKINTGALKSGIDNINRFMTPLDKKTAADYNRIVAGDNCRRINDICNVYILYYSAKLDALKESNIRNQNILCTAISEIIKQEEK